MKDFQFRCASSLAEARAVALAPGVALISAGPVVDQGYEARTPSLTRSSI